MIDENVEKITFEEAIVGLEKIVDELESSTLSLDRALELFQKGIVLVNHCNCKLEEAEGTIEILLKNRDGELSETPFDIETEETIDEL